MVGVNGAEMVFESLLGPVSDLTLRCDIMLPEGETVTLGLLLVEPDFKRGEVVVESRR